MIAAGVTHLVCDFCDAQWVGSRPPEAWRHYQLRRVDWGGDYMPGKFDNFVLCDACAGEQPADRLSLFRRLFARRGK